MVNRESNVFPGILGRTCDRPCEPACRRTRVDGKPVAICRLKRVAADQQGDDIRDRLPKAPTQKNGKKVALIGAGPASLTVANDLMPLGYQVTIFEKLPRPGGLMRINIPAFRLPEEVLDEEIGYIVDMGVEMRYDTPVESLKALRRLERVRRGVRRQRRAEGQGARDSRPPRHRPGVHRHRVARVDSFRPRRLGRRARADHRRRQHGDGLLPLGEAARRDRRQGHRAQDAQVLQGLAVGARGRRGRRRRDPREPAAGAVHHRERQAAGHGVRSVHVGRDRRQARSRKSSAASSSAATRWCWRSARTTRSRGSSATSASSSTRSGTCRSSTRPRSCRRVPGVFFGGDAAFGPANIIWAVEHGHQAAISIHNYCQGVPVDRASARTGCRSTSTKMGLHEWAYSNNYDPSQRVKMRHVEMPHALQEDDASRSKKGFTPEQTHGRSRALPQLRHRDALHRFAVHRMRRVHRHLSDRLPDDRAQRRRAAAGAAADGAAHRSRRSRCSCRARSSRPAG